MCLIRRLAKAFFYLLMASVLFACGGDKQAPKVVSTIPSNNDMSVDPSISEISATFNEPMQDGNWSWAYSQKALFPEMAGQPRFTNNLTTNVLPVKLEPNKEYEIWINSQSFQNFKDSAGNPATPYRLYFKTR